MKARDIAAQLQILLPQLTDRLTTDVPLASLTRSGTTMTAVALNEHGLKVGNAVSITGAVTPLTIFSLERVGTAGELRTDDDHDVSGNVFAQAKTVTISGATEAEFNGTFPIVTVENRKVITFTVTGADASTVTATGSPVLETGASALQDYNTLFAVSRVVSPSVFEFEQADTTRPSPIGTIIARTKPRITVAIDPQRMVEAYTRKDLSELWLFVVLDDVTASKSREIRSDAIDNVQRGNYFRQQIIQSFSLFLMVPTDSSQSGLLGRDEAEDLFRPICRSVLFSKFDSGLAIGLQGAVQFNTHAPFLYDVGVYAHQFSFQQTADLTFDDTVGEDLDVALRDICMDITPALPSGGTDINGLALEELYEGGTAEDPFSSDTLDLDSALVIPADPDVWSDDMGTSASNDVGSTGNVVLGIGNAWSIMYWVKLSSSSVQNILLFLRNSGSAADEILLRLGTGVVGWNTQVRDSAGTLFKDYSWDNPVTVGDWVQLFVTWDGTTLDVYTDGVSKTAGATKGVDASGTMTSTARGTYVGRNLTNSGDNSIDGRVHSFAYWSSKLTDAEVAAVYNAGDGTNFNIAFNQGDYASAGNLAHYYRPGLDNSAPPTSFYADVVGGNDLTGVTGTHTRTADSPT